MRAQMTMTPLGMFVIFAVSGAYPALSQVTQRTFSSPAAAGQNLFQAVQKNDEKAIDNIIRWTDGSSLLG
jgi:uncharacterized membrane protein YvbJ